MIYKHVINAQGKIEGVFYGVIEACQLATFPPNCYLVEMEENIFAIKDEFLRYYDQSTQSFISVERKGKSFVFDYTTKQWIDPRTLDEIKAQKWAEIKSQRDQLEFSGFEFEGNTYDSDQVSQGRIMGAASAGVDQTWTLADNTTVELSASQLQQLYAALQAHIAGVHERGRIARQLIYAAETKDQVEAIQL